MSHLIHAPVTSRDPLIGVGVVGVLGRVVPRRGDGEHGALGKQRHDVVFVEDQRMPAVIPIQLRDGFPAPVRIDGLENLVLPPHVHVAANAVDHGRPIQDVRPPDRRDAVGRDEEVGLVTEAAGRRMGRPGTGVEGHVRDHGAPERWVTHGIVLRLVVVGVEPDGDLQRGIDVVLVGVIVEPPGDHRARPDHPAVALGKDPAVRADRRIDQVDHSLAERAAGFHRIYRLTGHDEAGVGVVEDVARLGAVRPDGDRPDPPLGRDRLSLDLDILERRPRGGPLVHPVRLDRVDGRLEDRIRQPQLVLKRPRPPVGPLDRLGEIGNVAQGRPGVDPVHDRADLFLAQRGVVLEVRDTYRPVDGPGGHDPSHDAVPDHRSEGPHLLVRFERHGSHASGPVAPDAVLLDDRRDVPGVGQIGARVGNQGHGRRVLARVLRERVPDEPSRIPGVVRLGRERARIEGEE